MDNSKKIILDEEALSEILGGFNFMGKDYTPDEMLAVYESNKTLILKLMPLYLNAETAKQLKTEFDAAGRQIPDEVMVLLDKYL